MVEQIGTTGISIGLVKTRVGDSANSVGLLCKSNKINKWSKYKPFSSNALFHNTTTELLADLVTKHYGITVPSSSNLSNWATVIDDSTSYSYQKPTGGSQSVYRLGDFRYYNHDAMAPVNTLSSPDVRIPFSGHAITIMLGASGVSTGIGLSELFSYSTLSNTYLGILFSRDNWSTVYLATAQEPITSIDGNQVHIDEHEPFITDIQREWSIRAIGVSIPGGGAPVAEGYAVRINDQSLANASCFQLPFKNVAANNATFIVYPKFRIVSSIRDVVLTSATEWSIEWKMALQNGTHTSSITLYITGLELKKSGESSFSPYPLISQIPMTIPAGATRPVLSEPYLTNNLFASPIPNLANGDTIRLTGYTIAPPAVNTTFTELTIGRLEA